MDKITKISKFGFKLESMGFDWIKCDKFFIESKTFKDLKEGDFVDNVKMNKQGFVISLINLTTSSGVKEGFSPISTTPKSNSLSSPSSPELKILKGQCLNLGVAHIGNNYDLENSLNREKAIKLSRKLYEELIIAKYLEW